MLTRNLPNAGKLVNSLRSAGYDNVSAICDIVDNSIDAESSLIKVDIFQNKDDINIIIADNGVGMDEKILEEALKLGSLTDRDSNSDLGKYGLGLVTASWSMCKNILVITQKKKGEFLRNEIDIDIIQGKNDFVCDLGKANTKEIELYKKYIDNGCGTLVLLSKCDRIQNKDINIFANNVKKAIGQTYRYFIDSGIRFFIQGKEVEKIDPLMLNKPETEVYSDEKYEIFIKERGVKESIKAKIVVLPDYPEKLARQEGIGMKSQGFYLVRNNREIAVGKTLDLWSRHPDYNRIRVELKFSGNIDQEMGVNFTKKEIAPIQPIVDKIREEIMGQVKSIKKRIVQAQPRNQEDELMHDSAETIIANQAKLLITPQAEIERRGSPEKKADNKKQIREAKKRIREQFTRVHLSKKGMACKFLVRPMGEAGAIYEAEQEGKLVIIEWNSDHPFYKNFILANKNNQEIITATDLLIYSMATAELKTFTSDDNLDLLLSLKSIISANLRVLLS